LSETSLPPRGARARIDGAIGGALALIAISMAHAALPGGGLQPTRPARLSPPLAAARASASRPAPPPALIVFRPPLPDGEIGSPFGLRQLPWEDKPRLHAGLDMEAPQPEAVLASADGVVTRVGQDPGYGRFVELTHAEGLTTLYGHMESFAPEIRPGAAVKAGSPVGRIGSTGVSTGVHLHFEVHDRDGRPLNPELFLGRAFATAAELPLRAARRIPRRVRVAFVSRIPRIKQAQMQDRAERAQALQQLAALKVSGGRVRSVIIPSPQPVPAQPPADGRPPDFCDRAARKPFPPARPCGLKRAQEIAP